MTSAPSPWRARASVGARGLGWLLAFAAPLVVRAMIDARAELQLADEASAAGDGDAEIEHLGRALRWRVPFATHDEVALDRLFAIGEAAEKAGDELSALAAYREARGALLATRVLDVPHADARTELEARIAGVMAAQELRYGTDTSHGGDLEAHHLALLQATPGPSPVRATIAATTFVAWVVASLAVLLRGIDGTGRVRKRPAVLWGLASIACLVGWMIAWRFAG
ncbi:MAG TPA: hypothetical protein VFG69_04505 [Nannocystaceae bacterium]|nr:hypothetical protein [Nannocystaceae bacterium]